MDMDGNQNPDVYQGQDDGSYEDMNGMGQPLHQEGMEEEQPTMEASADHVANDANDANDANNAHSQQDIDGQAQPENENEPEMAQPEDPAANEEETVQEDG